MNTLEKVREKMNLNLTVYKAQNWNVAHFIPRPDAIYVILTDDPSLL